MSSALRRPPVLLCNCFHTSLRSCRTLVEGLGQADKQAYLGRAATSTNPKELETCSDLYNGPLGLLNIRYVYVYLLWVSFFYKGNFVHVYMCTSVCVQINTYIYIYMYMYMYRYRYR